MKTKLLWPLSLSIAVFGLLAQGRAFAITRTVGEPDCGKWVQTQNNGYERNLLRPWLGGFLSGMNVRHDTAGLSPPNPLAKISSFEQAAVWMDNYCRANPLKEVGDGAVELFRELQRK